MGYVIRDSLFALCIIQILELQRQIAELNRDLQIARNESADFMRSARDAGDRLRSVQKEADCSRAQLFELVRLCRQQERAHAALKATLKVQFAAHASVSIVFGAHACFRFRKTILGKPCSPPCHLLFRRMRPLSLVCHVYFGMNVYVTCFMLLKFLTRLEKGRLQDYERAISTASPRW